MIEVSVLLAVHNGAPSIDAAVESILTQTMRDWELIIVDDASTDETPAHLACFDDPRIRLLRSETNRGLAASLNTAFRASSGELIARMDADDVSLPHRLERQAEFLRAHPEIDVVGGAALFIGADGIFSRRRTHDQMARHAFTENPLIHPAVMMRRRFLEELGGYDESFQRAQDYDLWLRGITRFRYYNLEEPLIRYQRPVRATWKSSGAAARAVWLYGARAGRPVRGAYAAARYVAAFILAKLKQTIGA